ncbi:GGDEF domain-containing protein [Shewanella sp. 10N.286.48.A6]|uniref:GGDEF domain-containing protein n=1 Tax=Shewanella sp. 10N.286.48.A6 TaxID=1880833 RepID=UPI000C82B856|nr:diguanylate cyclase [Shewanella sp. 10N.286.48.A6]PMH96232.1 diguanylate cyclase [Shewanella sp. 10N.286.48.A6]
MTFPNSCIEKYYHLYQNLFNFSGVSWWLIDLSEDSNIYYCNDSMCDMFALDKQLNHHSVKKTCPIAGDYNQNIAIKDSQKANKIRDDYLKLTNGVIEEFNNRFPYYDSRVDDVLYFTSKARAVLRDDKGNAIILFGVIECERTSAELFKLLKIDSLTGLNNRREFDSQLDFVINLAKREQKNVSLIMCDIDYFKAYNDSLGHYQGDQCLIKVAQCIARVCSRSTDVVCRYGGEEFAIICYGENVDTAALAEDIRKGVYELTIPHFQGAESLVTLSVGFVTMTPDADTTAREFIEKADSALYRAKDQGKNCSIEFTLEVA